MDGRVEVADGRTIGFATFGRSDGVPVVWCHGGPGGRLEPAPFGDTAEAAGLLVVGIDRPGYGLSTPSPVARSPAGCPTRSRWPITWRSISSTRSGS